MTRTRMVASLVALAAISSLSLLAQAPPSDVYEVNYFAEPNPCLSKSVSKTDCPLDALRLGTVRIINPGTSGGELCAMIYVFTPDQQLAECCGCPLSRNALLTLDIAANLIENPLTGVIPTAGAIKIVSSAGATPAGVPTCDPAKLVPTPELRSWATHIQTGDVFTESEFLDATLSSAEVTLLQNRCRAIENNGSGQGICTCQPIM